MAVTIQEAKRDELGNKISNKVIKCNCCDTPIEIVSSWANECPNPDCGVEYNSAGQQLRDRKFWGEETGEQGHFGGGPLEPDDY